jgi:predicted RNase H-like nuclease
MPAIPVDRADLAGAAVLGIDAAWTDNEPSGVALIAYRNGRWRCLRVASSYCEFIAGTPEARPRGSRVVVSYLLAACTPLLHGAKPKVIAVDMPIGHGRIVRRRCADNAVSQHFGHAKCAVHSPTPKRPGLVGVRLAAGFRRAGYPMSTAADADRALPALIEVYPHVALLALAQSDQRLPYKCGKTTTYWKGAPLPARRRKLLAQWHRIERLLSREIDDTDPGLPPEDHDGPLSHLKHYEDRLDALICAWVGALYLEGSAHPLGDAASAIWVPSASMRFARLPHASR